MKVSGKLICLVLFLLVSLGVLMILFLPYLPVMIGYGKAEKILKENEKQIVEDATRLLAAEKQRYTDSKLFPGAFKKLEDFEGATLDVSEEMPSVVELKLYGGILGGGYYIETTPTSSAISLNENSPQKITEHIYKYYISKSLP